MKINLDMGHTLTGGDTGAEGNGRKEQDCTREIGYKVKAKLEALGHSVNVCSVDSATTLNESLAARVNNANANGGDLYVSIHLNAGGGHGTEVFTYGGKELSYARNVLNNICSLGYTNRGIKGANLYVINHTNMPAMLIECCFIDSSEDMNKYNAENIANAIVKGLVDETTEAQVSIENNPTINQPTGSQKVRELQTICCEYGNSIAVDGIWGPQTEAAVRNLPLCGLPYKTPSLTKWVQLRVGALVDGIFGQDTYNEVVKFQREHNLVQDGIVGFNTLKEMALC